MKKVLAFSALAAVLSINAAVALEGPKVSFDATFQSTGPVGSSTIHMMSDGKGHMKTESNARGQKVISLLDYPNAKATTLIESQHMAMEAPLRDTGETVRDEESAKRAHAKSLGAKVINGHPCHGYEYSNPNGTSVVWIGDDIKYMVRSEITPKGETKPTLVTELKSWSNKGPGEEAFKVPGGYKMMQIPTTR